MKAKIQIGLNNTGFLHYDSAVVKHLVEFVRDSKGEIRILNIWQKHRTENKMREIDFIGYDWNQVSDIIGFQQRCNDIDFIQSFYIDLIEKNIKERTI